MLRFSLLSLLSVVLVAAIGSAALANPTNIWARGFVTGAVGILAAVTLVALVKRSALPFALGFTLIGWLYIAIAFGGVFGVRKYLLTERTTGWLFGLIHVSDGDRNLFYPPSAHDSYDATTAALRIPPEDPQDFIGIVRSLWTLILATIGGLFASWLSRPKPPPPE